MIKFIVSSRGHEDLWIIWEYLAQNSSVSMADRIEAELFDTFEKLANMPGIGHARQDLTDHDVFFFPVYQYLIVYRKNVPLEVVAVIHGKRDVKRILAKRFS